MQVFELEVYHRLQQIAAERGITIQELLRAVVIPEWESLIQNNLKPIYLRYLRDYMKNYNAQNRDKVLAIHRKADKKRREKKIRISEKTREAYTELLKARQNIERLGRDPKTGAIIATPTIQGALEHPEDEKPNSEISEKKDAAA